MSAAKRASLKDKSPLDDLFRTTGPGNQETTEETKEPPAGAKPERDHAVKAGSEDLGELRQTTLMAYEDQLSWLALKVIEARTNGGKAISKSDIIRSLINLAKSAPVDLTGLSSEEELIERLEEAIKTK